MVSGAAPRQAAARGGRRGGRGKNRAGRSLREIASEPSPILPEKPRGGAEAYISDRAPGLMGNRRVNNRGVRYRGGVSPEEAVSRTTEEFAALPDAEKDAWTARANGDDLRGPADRANQAAYESARAAAMGGGRPVAASAAVATPISDGGTGFTGMSRSMPGARGIAMRTPDQVAARIASSPVSVTGKPIATIRQSTANNYDPAAYKANVALDGKLIAPTPGAAPASANAPTTGGVRMNDSLHNRPAFDESPPAKGIGVPVAQSAGTGKPPSEKPSAIDTRTYDERVSAAGQAALASVPAKPSAPAPTPKSPGMQTGAEYIKAAYSPDSQFASLTPAARAQSKAAADRNQRTALAVFNYDAAKEVSSVMANSGLRGLSWDYWTKIRPAANTAKAAIKLADQERASSSAYYARARGKA